MKKILSIVLVLCMVLSMIPASVGATGTAAEDTASLESRMREELFSQDTQVSGETPMPLDGTDENETIRVIVELSHQPALSTMSTVGSSASLLSQETAALNSQEAVIQSVSRNLGLEPVHRMGYTMNTVSYDIRRGDIERLRQTPGVVSVTEAVKYQVEMISAKDICRVYDAWKLGSTGYTGKNTVIAIIDSGTNYQHRDMVQNPEHVRYTQDEMEEKIVELGHGQWFSDKVPYGYCYVTGHNEILSRASRHGYHVSGIAAATGDEENGGIRGVAPDAQVLAMQVFEGSTGDGGYSDDIICAIEDAVKLGADVINMSLGTDGGFYGSDRYISRAVDCAEEAGVFVSVAAGNSAISSESEKQDSVITNDWFVTDVSTVSDPATATGATAVASVDSYGFSMYRLGITPEGSEEKVIQGIRLCTKQFDYSDVIWLKDCGAGSEEDWDRTRPEAAQNIALVSLEESDFETTDDLKYQVYACIRYAEMYGWGGVIFYSPRQEADMLRKVAAWSNTFDNYTLAFYVDYETGSYLHELCRTNTSVFVSQYQGFLFASEAVENNTSSIFSSWGTTPTLEIKPELAAPGGNVISLEGGEATYAQMSGTSMAAPFVAGAGALLKQMLLETGLEIDDVPDFIRTTLMNTARPVLQCGTDTIASVRQVGAGLIDVEAALQNRVTATCNGKAAIELRDQVGAQTSGKLVLTNHSDTPVTYSLTATDVFTDYTNPQSKAYYDVAMPDSYVSFQPATVTVPARGTAQVTFTLHIAQPKDGHFVEGYLQLISQSTGTPSLNVPYLGFMGDWDAEPIIDQPEWESDAVIPLMDYGYYGPTSHGTCLVTIQDGAYSVLGEEFVKVTSNVVEYAIDYVNPDRIAISPNGDGYSDIVIPLLGMLRNAQEIRFDVLDAQGNMVAQPGSVQNVTKMVNAATSNSTEHSKLANNSPFWDGLRYNPSTGAYEVVPEGHYTVRLQSRIREDASWQTVTMPVTVDLTPPEITYFEAERTSQSSICFKFRLSEKNFIRNSCVFSINDEVEGWDVGWFDYDEETGIYTADYTWYGGKSVPMDEPVHVAVMLADDAGNYALKQGVTGGKETQACGLSNLSLEEVNYISSCSMFKILGFAPEGSTATLNGIPATFDGDTFYCDLPIPGEVNPVDVVITSPDGTILLSKQIVIHACSTPVQYAAPLLDKVFPAAYYGTFQSDPYTGLKTNNSMFVLDQDYEGGTELPLRIKIGSPDCISVTATNMTTNQSVRVYPDKEGYVPFVMTLDGETGGAKCRLTFRSGGDTKNSIIEIWNHTPGQEKSKYLSRDWDPYYWNLNSFTYVHSDMLQKDGTFRVKGYLYNPVDQLTVAGIEATILPETLEWYCDIPLETGINLVPIVSYHNNYAYNQLMHKIVFSDGPALELHLPAPAKDGKYYVNTANYLLTGSVTCALDDATVYVNDSQVLNGYNSGHPYGEEFITREFSQPLNLQHGDNIITVTTFDTSNFRAVETITLNYCASNGMTDIERGAWYHEDVDFILECGLMIGVSENQFAPNREMTRGQLVTVLYRLSGQTVEKHVPNPFQDVQDGAFYADAVRWAYAKGIVQGISATRFAPNAPVTREQMVTMLSRYAGNVGLSTDAGADLSAYTDANYISSYAKAPLSWAVGNGLILGVSGSTLAPKGSATRAQLAAILARFCKLLEANN